MPSIYCKEVQTLGFRYCRISTSRNKIANYYYVTSKKLKYGVKTCCNWPCINVDEQGNPRQGGDTLGANQTNTDSKSRWTQGDGGVGRADR